MENNVLCYRIMHNNYTFIIVHTYIFKEMSTREGNNQLSELLFLDYDHHSLFNLHARGKVLMASPALFFQVQWP